MGNTFGACTCLSVWLPGTWVWCCLGMGRHLGALAHMEGSWGSWWKWYRKVDCSKMLKPLPPCGDSCHALCEMLAVPWGLSCTLTSLLPAPVLPLIPPSLSRSHHPIWGSQPTPAACLSVCLSFYPSHSACITRFSFPLRKRKHRASTVLITGYSHANSSLRKGWILKCSWSLVSRILELVSLWQHLLPWHTAGWRMHSASAGTTQQTWL